MREPVGTWRSLVAYLNGVQGVPGSNPGVPTKSLTRGSAGFDARSGTVEHLSAKAYRGLVVNPAKPRMLGRLGGLLKTAREMTERPN